MTIGEAFSHYKILDKLGEGGMGVVYRALDTRLNRPVALKLLRQEAMADPARKKRFIQEAQAASALNHPNIITIYDIDTWNDADFMAMEYVEGTTLDAAIGRKGLRLGEALKYAVQIADALAAAHAAGIVHRDLKPANIMVTEKGLVKVLDFGLAKLTEPAPEGGASDESAATLSVQAAPQTEEGTILGTVAYMSPEQAEGKKVDGRSDIFSFGAMLYEMLTGRRPFQGETKLSILTAILHKEPQPLTEIAEVVPRELEWILARCLRKDPGRRFQTMADLKVALEELKEESDSGRLASGGAVAARQPRRWNPAIGIGVAVVVVLVGGVAWWLGRTRSTAPAPGPVEVRRLTSDSGLTTEPALSPDGKLVAYASDRGGEDNLDIWVQNVAGGETVRLTRDPADEHEPTFSPDGSKIAFRSEKDGGGIYVIPSIGGDARLITKEGRRPRFSPDGKQIAYWVGTRLASANIYVVASTGGRPTQVQAEFAGASCPIWAPDGKHLLFWGFRSRGVDLADRIDWWAAPLDVGAATRTGAFAAFRRRGLKMEGDAIFDLVPGDWVGDHVIFSGQSRDSANLWQVPVSPITGQVTGDPQQLTFGTGLELQPSVAVAPEGARMVFSSLISNLHIWSLPLAANQGNVTGAPKQLTSAAYNAHSDLSADGKKLVFISNRSGNQDVWLKDLESGRETALTVTPVDEFGSLISADGTRVAYQVVDNQKRPVYVVDLEPDGRPRIPEKVCDDCRRIWDLSSNGSKILFMYGNLPYASVGLLDVASRKKTELLKHPEYGLYRLRFSPDDRWISINGQLSPDRTRMFIAPFRDGAGAPPDDWIPVTDSETWYDKARWSPDGNMLYFTSNRDGFRCIRSQRLDPVTKRPVGPQLDIYHAHSARRSLLNAGVLPLELSVGPDKLVFHQGEMTGNIWMAKLP